jgi:DNA-binding transcriptional MerR regulator
MDSDSVPRQYSLEDLARLTGISERTIRGYIYDGLLPEPVGRGRATTYTQEHLEKLQFIIAVRRATPYELPLPLVRQLLQSLPPQQVSRIARGEETVEARLMTDIDPVYLRRRSRAHADMGLEPSVSESRAVPTSSHEELWISMDVTPDLRLSMRGADEAKRLQLESLAQNLRRWIQGAPPA